MNDENVESYLRTQWAAVMIHSALINVPPQKCSPRSFKDTIQGYSPTWAFNPLTTFPLRIFCWPHSTSATRKLVRKELQLSSTHCYSVNLKEFSILLYSYFYWFITVEEAVHRWADKNDSNQNYDSLHFLGMFRPGFVYNAGFNRNEFSSWV